MFPLYAEFVYKVSVYYIMKLMNDKLVSIIITYLPPTNIW